MNPPTDWRHAEPPEPADAEERTSAGRTHQRLAVLSCLGGLGLMLGGCGVCIMYVPTVSEGLAALVPISGAIMVGLGTLLFALPYFVDELRG